MPRTFVAVESSGEVRNELSKIQDELENTGADLKLVGKENIHMTLRFLGDVSENRLEFIEEAIRDSCNLQPFEAEVKGMGIFPNPNYIRVIWAGVDSGASELESLRENLDENFSDIDISSDDKDFTPHYTIARVKSGKAKDKLRSIVERNSDTMFGTVEVDNIKLMKSDLTPDGPIYTPLEVFDLG